MAIDDIQHATVEVEEEVGVVRTLQSTHGMEWMDTVLR